MTNKETITRNIGLTFDFVNYLIDNPKLSETLPDKFKLKFVESDFVSNSSMPKTRHGKKTKEKYVKVRNAFELAIT